MGSKLYREDDWSNLILAAPSGVGHPLEKGWTAAVEEVVMKYGSDQKALWKCREPKSRTPASGDDGSKTAAAQTQQNGKEKNTEVVDSNARPGEKATESTSTGREP